VRKFPVRPEQGIFSSEQGIHPSEQGILSSDWFHGNGLPAFGKCLPLNGAVMAPRQPSSTGRNRGGRRDFIAANRE
jgi:hypothetical protein